MFVRLVDILKSATKTSVLMWKPIKLIRIRQDMIVKIKAYIGIAWDMNLKLML